MNFIATAAGIWINSFGIQMNWPVIGIVALAVVAAWLVFVLIRKR